MEKMSELINWLVKCMELEGDLPVRVDTLSHCIPPDPQVRTRGGRKVLVLNS